MKKSKHTPFLMILAFVAFFLASVEGYIYFEKYSEHIVLRIIMTIQNSLSAFVFSPTVKVADVFGNITQESHFIEYFLLYAYAIALFAAQLCTATVVFTAFKSIFLKSLAGIRNFGRRNIVIFGYNDKVKYLINNLYIEEKKHKEKTYVRKMITLVTKDFVDEAEKNKLMSQYVSVVEMDITSASEKNIKKLVKKISNRNDEIEMILFEESSIRNYSIYTKISKSESLRELNPKCYLFCEEGGIRESIETSCQKIYDNSIDLKIFSLAEMKVRDIFERNGEECRALHSITDMLDEKTYIEESNRFDVHILILGFGSIGRQTLIYALNQGVMHSNSRIWIDIVDKNALEKDDFFMKRFRPEYMKQVRDGEYYIAREEANGELRIRFHNVNIYEKAFAKLLNDIVIDGDKVFPLTYVVASFKEADILAECIIELKKHLRSQENIEIPKLRMAVCTELGNSLVDCFNDSGELEILEAGSDKKILKLENIISREFENRAKEYNFKYDCIYNMIEKYELPEMTRENIDNSWNSKLYEDKMSNYALGEHQKIKEKILKAVWHDSIEQKMELYFGENGTLLQLDGNAYIYDVDKFVENLEKDENKFIKEMIKLEHRRWCYFEALHGWKYIEQESGKKKKSTKEHPCLCDFDTLKEKHKDKIVYDLIPFMVKIE